MPKADARTRPSKPGSGPPAASAGAGPVILAMVIAAISFLGAAVYMETHAAAIDHDAVQIEDNALPSVEHLSQARSALWQLEMASHLLIEDSDAGARHTAEMQVARRDVNQELAAEFATDNYPGESELQASAMHVLGELDTTLDGLRAHAEEHDKMAFERMLRRQFEDADDAIERIQVLNAEQGHAEARRIAAVRSSSIRLTFALNVACLGLTALAAAVALRAVRRRRELEVAHEAMLESRAAELERFASRVAHDLLAPLSALHFTLSSLKRNVDKGLPVDEPVERARACLKRSQDLVNGVMDFARSGAPKGGRANLKTILEGLIEEVRADAPEVEIAVEGVDASTFVGCSAGVLGSILSNLVRNAVKYLGERPEKRVTVRTTSRGGTVRVEVEDTGPGLSPELKEHVFEPYVRSENNAAPGLGLGLATVERFVESHGGRVGVESSLGQGSLFWFELPRADAGPPVDS